MILKLYIQLLKNAVIYLRNNPEKKIANFLKDKNLWIKTAESCTGGLISSRLTDISGSSGFINLNLVTYANDIKEEYLGVNREILEEQGAVSSEVAKEMVTGLLKKGGTDIAISITGIAGPTGEVAGKPVGLVYIGIGNKDIIEVKKIEVNQDKYFGIKRDKKEKNKYNTFELILARKLTKFIFSQVALELLYDFLLKRYNNNR